MPHEDDHNQCCACCYDKDGHNKIKAHVVPYRERGCTDFLFLLAFLASWAVIAALLGWAEENGANPYSIVRGADWEGKLCGAPNGHEDYPYAAWPDPIFGKYIKVCVKECSVTSTWKFAFKYSAAAIHPHAPFCIPTILADAAATAAASAQNLTTQIGNSTYNYDSLNNVADAAQNAMGDMLLAYKVILGSALFALVLSFIYTYMLQCCGHLMVALIIILITFAGAMCGGVLLYNVYIQKADFPLFAEYTQQALKTQEVIGWIIICATLIFLLVVFAIRKQIAIAVEVVKQAAVAIEDMPYLIFMPIIPLLFALLYMICWCFVSLLIFSVTVPHQHVVSDVYPDSIFKVNASQILQVPEPFFTYLNKSDAFAELSTQSFKFAYLDFEFKRLNNTDLGGIPNFGGRYDGHYMQLEWNEDTQKAFAIVFFHLLWVIQFIIYLTYIIFAGVIGEWYFSFTDENGHKKNGTGDNLSRTPCCDSCCRVFRFHLGTVAFGAFCIAVIQFLRAVVHYIEYKTKDEQNKIQKCIFCMIKGCLRCVECCCDKISKNALVWTAIFGTSFLTSACSSFALMWANLIRVAAFDAVSLYLLSLGKFFVTLSTAGFSAIVMYQLYGIKPVGELNNIMMPAFVTLSIGYMVASLFMSLLEVTADTIFVCFVIDESYNKETHMMFAPDSLRELVDKHAARSAEIAKRRGAHGGASKEEANGDAPADGLSSSQRGDSPSAEVRDLQKKDE